MKLFNQDQQPMISQSRMIAKRLAQSGQVFLRQSNFEKQNIIAFSCFDSRDMVDSPETVAVFLVKSKRS